MNIKRERLHIVIAGLIIGVIASLLVFFGNPANMGFCIACFLRDTAGGLGLHRAAAVQYIRPQSCQAALLCLWFFRFGFRPAIKTGNAGFEDRKSTRLNSSH